MGWAPLLQLLSESVPIYRGARAQVQLAEDRLRPIPSLLEEGNAFDRQSLDLANPGSCKAGHVLFAGHCWTCLAPEELRSVVVIETPAARAFHSAVWAHYKEAHQAEAIRSPYRVQPIGEVVHARRPCRLCFPSDWQADDSVAGDLDGSG